MKGPRRFFVYAAGLASFLALLVLVYPSIERTWDDLLRRWRLAKIEEQQRLWAIEKIKQTDEVARQRSGSETPFQDFHDALATKQMDVALSVARRMGPKSRLYGELLLRSIQYRAVPLIEFLLENGADPNTRKCQPHQQVNPEFCDTPFTSSIRYRDPKMVSPFLKKRALVNLDVTVRRETVLQIACTSGSLEVVKLLIEAGANVNQVGGNGETPLIAAIRTGADGLVELLLSKGADPNLPKDGNSPLLLAAGGTKGRFKDINLLLEAGSKTDRLGPHEEPLWLMARCSGDPDRVRALESAGISSIKNPATLANTLGLRAHNAKDHKAAVELFRCAVSLDPRNALANYNLACAIAVWSTKARDNEELDPTNELTLDQTWYLKKIITPLRTSIELDPGRKRKALVDPDLRPVQTTLFFKILKGEFNPTSDAAIRPLLLSKWWSSKNDCGGGLSADYLQFTKSGEVFAGCGSNSRTPADPESTKEYLIADSFLLEKGTIKLVGPKTSLKEMQFKFDGLEGVITVSTGPRKGYSWHEFTGYSPSP